jgi:hypothetical protein
LSVPENSLENLKIKVTNSNDSVTHQLINVISVPVIDVEPTSELQHSVRPTRSSLRKAAGNEESAIVIEKKSIVISDKLGFDCTLVSFLFFKFH